jgi:hypothetical protein
MATQQTPKQRATVRRVMHEFKHGELDRGRGGKVRNPKQAIAIALSEAGASNRQSPKTNRKRLAATKRKERAGQTAQAAKEGRARASRTLRGDNSGRTREQLYAEARRRGVVGRSRMNKRQLERALGY